MEQGELIAVLLDFGLTQFSFGAIKFGERSAQLLSGLLCIANRRLWSERNHGCHRCIHIRAGSTDSLHPSGNLQFIINRFVGGGLTRRKCEAHDHDSRQKSRECHGF